MAHRTRVRLNLSAWNSSASVLGSEFDALDAGQFASIDGDSGGTWAPSGLITLGGSGLTVSGPFIASSCSGVTLTNGNQIVVQSGAQLTVNSGGFIVAQAGSTSQFVGLLEVTGSGTFQLDGSVDVTYGTPRTVTTHGVEFLSSTVSAGANTGGTYVSTFDFYPTVSFGGSGGPPSVFGPQVAQALKLTQTTEACILRVPGLIRGATLVSVAFNTVFIGSGSPSIWPTFIVSRVDQNGVISSLRAAGAVTDHHSTGVTYTSHDFTTFTCDQLNVIDPGTYSYFICVTPSSLNSGSGSAVFITDVAATYSVPALKPR